MRYIVFLSYDGSAFCGWQSQPLVQSVQQTLENAISRLLGGSPIRVTGAGRTDTGVNASNYTAHFDTPLELPCSEEDFAYKLSAILPSQIAVHKVCACTGTDFHARFSARRRTYKYFIHFQKNPFVDKYSCRCWYDLDIEKMNLACRKLLGTHDFSCFEKSGGSNSTSVCTVSQAVCEYYTPESVSLMGYPQGKYMVFTISADRFLRNMVRAIVGSLIEVGRGRKDPEWFDTLLESGTRCDAGESVVGYALFLTKVEY